MDTLCAPFSNLDIHCIWTGNPHAEVDVEVHVDIQCFPNTELLVLDTRHPPRATTVRGFTLTRKAETPSESLEHQEVDCDLGPSILGNELEQADCPASPQAPSSVSTNHFRTPVEINIPKRPWHLPSISPSDSYPRYSAPVTPTPVSPCSKDGQALIDLTGCADSLPDAEPPLFSSESESIIVQRNLHQDGFLASDIVPDPFCAGLKLKAPCDRVEGLNDLRSFQGSPERQSASDGHQSPGQGSPDQKIPGQQTFGQNISFPQTPGYFGNSVLPRKRSAKAASLPDSVTDSERGFGGSKRLVDTSSSPSIGTSPGSSHSHSRPRSFIPRPRQKSTSQIQSRSESTSKPRSLPRGESAPTLEVDFRRFESDISPLFKHDKSAKEKENDSCGRSKDKNSSPEIYSKPASPVTPSKSGPEGSNGAMRTLRDLEKLSTVAVIGSPCDFTGLPGVSDRVSSTDSPGESAAAAVQLPRVSIGDAADDNSKEPRLIFNAGKFFLVASSHVEPALYQARFDLSVRLQDGRPGWRELVISGLPHLGPQEDGYVYFKIPREHSSGFEFRTSNLKRHKVVEECVMAQMLISSRLNLTLRLCDQRFFGYLKDFNVIQDVRANIIRTSKIPNGGSFSLVKFHAICSINLIKTDFSAEKCGLLLYIHGGPTGEFFCRLPKSSFPEIDLQTTDREVGVSILDVLAYRSNLEKFAITWEAKVPEGSPIWMPRIRANDYAEAGLENELREEYISKENDNLLEVVKAEATDQDPASQLSLEENVPPPPPAQKPNWKSWRHWISSTRLIIGILLVVFIFRMYWRILDNLCLDKQLPETWCTGNDQGTHRMDIFPECQTVGHVEDIGEIVEIQPLDQTIVDSEDESGNIIRPIPAPVPVPLRDRLDYILGWGGPL